MSEPFPLSHVTAEDLKLLLTAPLVRSRWVAVASEHLHVRIANAPPLVGRTAALDALEKFLGRITGFGCHYCDFWQRREAIYAETDVRFVAIDGQPCEIPCAIVARVAGGRLQDIRFHLDPSPIP